MINWWTEETSQTFRTKAQCIIEQYGNYTYPSLGLKLDGKSTENENIADNGGFRAAYLAYQQFVEKKGLEPLLKGLNYTQTQLFWISAAQNWCSVDRKGSYNVTFSQLISL